MATKSDRPGLLQIGWRRKSLIALCLFIGLIAGGLFYLQSTPSYQSEAKVLVVKKRPEVITGENTAATDFDDYVSTQRILIQSPLIVERAIQLGNFRSLRTFANESGDLTEAVIKKLSVGRASPESSGNPNSVLWLSFRGPVADECGTIVNSILDSYRAFLDDTYRDMSDDTRNLLAQTKKVLLDDLEKRQAEHRAFREQSPMLWKGKEDINPLQERLAQIEAQRSVLLLRQADLEGQLKTLEAAQKAGKSHDELLALVFELSGKEDSIASDRAAPVNFKSQVLPLLLEDRTLSADYGPNHPQVQAVRQRIQAMRNFFVLPSSVSVPGAKGGGAGTVPEIDPVDAYARYLNQERDRTLVQEQTIAKLYKSVYDEARKLNSYEIRDADFQSGIDATKLLYDGLVKRLQDTGLAKLYGGYEARVIAPAGMGKKVFPSLWLVAAGSVFISLLCGFGLAFLAEATDKRFRTLDDIRNQLLLPIMACIPAVAVGEAIRRKKALGGKFSPMLVAHYQPRSIVAESYRGVRTALFFSDGASRPKGVPCGHKVVQFTSSTSGEGKSVVAANVAVCIAQTGKRTLLIDADLRKPQLHELFSISSELGLSSVISGEAEYADAIQETSVPNLSVLPCGPLPSAPAELLSSPRLAELLETFRDQYDYVLLDSSPVLAVTDAPVVAQHVDGVLLVVRTSKAGRPMAERTRDVLHTLGAKILGVVVNAAETGSAHSYAYGCAYGYASVADNVPSTLPSDDISRPREVPSLAVE